MRPVIFDLDGVLVDSEPVYERAFVKFLGELGRGERSELFALTLGRREVDFVPALAKRLGIAEPDVKRGLERAMAGMIGGLRPMPFATEVIGSLHAEGRRLAVATSSLARFAAEALKGLEVESMLDAVVSGEEVRLGKPSPEIYQLAASRIGADPGRCIAIEDTPAGIAAATGAGMTCIAVPHALSPRNGLAGADILATDLRAAASAIREFE
jgi:HAD superfamily hydrolase (TIGR01509 family)